MANKVEQLDRVFSIFIRTREVRHDGYTTCYTCGVIKPWQEMQCGHFMRRANMTTRFHEDNCRVQCNDCNVNRNGMEDSFEENLRLELGDEEVENLIKLSKTTQGFSDDELSTKVAFYKATLRDKGVIV